MHQHSNKETKNTKTSKKHHPFQSENPASIIQLIRLATPSKASSQTPQNTDSILRLQSLIGNQAVLQLMRGNNLQLKATTSRPPQLSMRCRRREISVPKSFPEFITQVKKWIATCVLSRTKKPDGDAYKREDELVDNNGTLYAVWNRIKHLGGVNMKVFAKYYWEQTSRTGWMVDYIRFYVSEYENIELRRPPPPKDINFDTDEGETVKAKSEEKAVEIVKQAFMRTHPNPFGSHRALRILGLLQAIMHNPDIDDAYIALDDAKFALQYHVSNDTPLNREDLEDLGMLRHLKSSIILMANSSDTSIFSQLMNIEEQMWKGMSVIAMQSNLEKAADKGRRFLIKWVAEQQQNPQSIYHAFSRN